MAFLVLPAIGAIAFDPASLLTTYPTLGCQAIGHGLSQLLFSYLRRATSRKGLSRHEMRKIANRKRRWFVDNIIMHHRRLAEKNRQMIIQNSFERVLNKKRQENEFLARSQNGEDSLNDWGRTRWRGGESKNESNEKNSIILERIKEQKNRQLSWVNTQIEESRDKF